MAETDAALITAAHAGDRAAIDELLARYEERIYRFGLRMCGDEESAREVLQETMLAAFRHLPGFRGQAALSTWLFQIARSFCIKERRGAHATTELDPQLADQTPTPEAHAHAREVGAALSAAISTLPADQREVLVLRDVEGLSAEEAADVVGIEVGALKSRLHRARMELRQKLAASLGPGGPGASAPCAELSSELAAYATQEIDQAACAHIEEHLKSCPRCAAACDTLQRTVSFCRQIPGGEVPPAVRAAVRAALLGGARQ